MTYWLGKRGKGRDSQAGFQCNAQGRGGADVTIAFLAPTDTLIHAAGRWFLQSGIQDASGGVARFYRSDLRQNAHVSTEITGYAVSALLFLHRRTGDCAYLEAGLRAARFLTRIAWDAQLGTFPFELSSNGALPLAYFFDSGIIVRGLLSAWRATEDVEFRDVAIAAGRAMLADFPSREGIHPILALPEKRPVAWEPRWSMSPGCYQLKSAMAWHGLFEITGESAFSHGYESALEAALENDRDFLPGESDLQRVMDRLHAYGYFLEASRPCWIARNAREHFATAWTGWRDFSAKSSRFLPDPMFMHNYCARDCGQKRAV